AGPHNGGGGLEHQPNKADLDPADFREDIGWEGRLAGVRDQHVGGQILELRPFVAAELAHLGGVERRGAAAVLQPQQLLVAPVELVVAHRAKAHAEVAQGFEGGLVGQERGRQRASTDQIARSYQQGVGVFGLDLLDHGCDDLDPSGLDGAAFAAVGGIGVVEGAGQQVAVDVVNREQRDVYGLGSLWAVGPQAVRASERAVNKPNNDALVRLCMKTSTLKIDP